MKHFIFSILLLSCSTFASFGQDRTGLLVNTGVINGSGYFMADGFYPYRVKFPSLGVGQYYQTWKSSNSFRYFTFELCYIGGEALEREQTVIGNQAMQIVKVHQGLFEFDFGRAWTFGSYSIRDKFMPYYSLGMSMGAGFSKLVSDYDLGMALQFAPLCLGVGFETNLTRRSVANFSMTLELGTRNYLQFGIRILKHKKVRPFI